MRSVNIRAPQALYRRLGHAAVDANQGVGIYAQRLLRAWSARQTAPSACVESGPSTDLRIPLSEPEHRAFRLLAAEWDVSLNQAALRVLDAMAPPEPVSPESLGE